MKRNSLQNRMYNSNNKDNRKLTIKFCDCEGCLLVYKGLFVNQNLADSAWRYKNTPCWEIIITRKEFQMKEQIKNKSYWRHSLLYLENGLPLFPKWLLKASLSLELKRNKKDRKSENLSVYYKAPMARKPRFQGFSVEIWKEKLWKRGWPEKWLQKFSHAYYSNRSIVITFKRCRSWPPVKSNNFLWRRAFQASNM